MEKITANELSASLHRLASDYFEGTATGTRCQVAAGYASAFCINGCTSTNDA